MATTYTPAAGTVAARVVAWLTARPSGEYNAAQIGEALKIDPKIIASSLEVALRERLVFHRQRVRGSPRAPWWYSARDREEHARRNGFAAAATWMPAPKKDSTAGPPASDGAASEGTAVTPGPSQLEAAPKCEAGGDGSPARAAASTVATASAGAAVEGKGELPHQAPPDERRREVSASFAATLRAAMALDEQMPPADLAATRRAVHAPPEPAPLAFRAARFTDGTLATERDGIVVAVYSAAEVDAIQKLLGVRG